MVRTLTRTSIPAIIMAVAGLIAGFIVLAIVLILLDANQGNMIINAIVEVGRFFTTPFHEMFLQPTVDRDVLVNWGIAALVYLLVGALIARLAK